MTPDFAQWLKLERERAGLSKRELARRLGCTGTMICFIESGRNMPGWSLMAAIGDVFGVDITIHIAPKGAVTLMVPPKGGPRGGRP